MKHNTFDSHNNLMKNNTLQSDLTYSYNDEETTPKTKQHRIYVKTTINTQYIQIYTVEISNTKI